MADSKVNIILESQYRGKGVDAARRDLNGLRDELVKQAAATGRNVSEVVDRGLMANRRTGRNFAESLQADMERRGALADEEAMLAVSGQRVELLQREANLGDQKSLRMLRQIQMESRHAAEMQRLVALSKNALLSDQARAQVNAQIVQLQRVQNAELSRLNAQSVGGTAGAGGRGGFLGGFSQDNALTKGLAVAGGIFAGLEVVKGGLRVIGVGTAAIRGDVDAIDDNMSKLPFGLGEIYSASRDVYGQVSGITQEFEAQQARLKAIAQWEQRRTDQAKKFGEELRKQREEDEALRRSVEMGELRGSDRRSAEIARAMNEEIRARRDWGEEVGENPEMTERAVANIRRRAEQQLDEIRRAFAEQTEEIEFDVRIGNMNEMQAEMAQAQRRFERDQQAIRDDLLVVGLEEAGRRERAIRERLEQEIADIRRRHSDGWLSDLREKLPGIWGSLIERGREAWRDMLDARSPRERAADAVRMPTAVESRFLTGVGGSQANPYAPLVDEQKKTTAATERNAEALRMLADLLRQNRLIAAGAFLRR